MPAILWLGLSVVGGTACAGQLRDALRDKTLSCGVNTEFYLDPAGNTLLVSGYGPVGGTGIAEAAVALGGGPLLVDERDRLEIAVAGPPGSTRLLFRQSASASVLSGKPGKIELFVDADPVGDECVIERGRAHFVEARFNDIREGLCGNDPLDACIAELRRTCGAWPDANCVGRVRPALERINARRHESTKPR